MATDTEWTRIMDTVQIQLPGVRVDVAKHELYMVVDQFLDESNIWREEVVFNTVAGVTEYDLEPENVAYVARLFGVFTENNSRMSATMMEPAIVVLNVEPSSAFELTAVYSLRLKQANSSDDFPTVPQWLLRKYRAGVLDGVKARLMMQPAKPYTNERLSIVHERRFISAISAARNEASRKNLWGAQAWRFPEFK